MRGGRDHLSNCRLWVELRESIKCKPWVSGGEGGVFSIPGAGSSWSVSASCHQTLDPLWFRQNGKTISSSPLIYQTWEDMGSHSHLLLSVHVYCFHGGDFQGRVEGEPTVSFGLFGAQVWVVRVTGFGKCNIQLCSMFGSQSEDGGAYHVLYLSRLRSGGRQQTDIYSGKWMNQ